MASTAATRPQNDWRQSWLVDPPPPPGGLRCEACGHEGSDVTRQWHYTGGRGEVRRTWCISKTLCWARQEKARADAQ